MKEICAALAAFWGGFLGRGVGTPVLPIPAYPSGYAALETTRGTEAPETPYITYDVARGSFGEAVALSGRFWTHSSSRGLMDDVLAQAAERVPESGLRLDLGAAGTLVLYRGNPFCETLPPEEGDPRRKSATIRLLCKFYTV